MILRALGTLVLLALLGLDLALPATPVGRRGVEGRVRREAPTEIVVGKELPDLRLHDLDGRPVDLAALRGEPVVLAFGRSLDWSPWCKARLLGLREALASEPVRIVWVMSGLQVNARTRAFVEELGLAEEVLLLIDPHSEAIRELGLLAPDPMSLEKGVPHPTTVLLDTEGRVRLVDVRDDPHIWLDPRTIRSALDRLKVDTGSTSDARRVRETTCRPCITRWEPALSPSGPAGPTPGGETLCSRPTMGLAEPIGCGRVQIDATHPVHTARTAQLD